MADRIASLAAFRKEVREFRTAANEYEAVKAIQFQTAAARLRWAVPRRKRICRSWRERSDPGLAVVMFSGVKQHAFDRSARLLAHDGASRAMRMGRG
jgi:hypothetical protein